MERIMNVIEDVKDYVSDKVETIRDCVDDKVDTVKDFYGENKDEIHNLVYFVVSASALLYVSKQHIDDTERICDLNTKVKSMEGDNINLAEANQRLSEVLDESNMENEKLKEKMEDDYRIFKTVISDGTRHGSSEAARQLAYLAHSESYKESN